VIFFWMKEMIKTVAKTAINGNLYHSPKSGQLNKVYVSLAK